MKIYAFWIALALAAVVAFPGSGHAAAKTIELRVLSYNVNDLPWPLRKKAKSKLKFIGNDLARRRADGTAPDIVLLQEAFTDRSKSLIKNAGYPYVIKGPGRRATIGSLAEQKKQKIRMVAEDQGTDSTAYVGSGLYVLSRYPIVASEFALFGDACSGNDCKANKAVLLVRVQLPGLPTPLDVVTSHMDADKKGEASRKKRLKAHKKQSKIVRAFLDRFNAPKSAIFAGDLNIKNVSRYQNFVAFLDVKNAGKYCIETPSVCKTGTNATADTLWRSTNDQHFIIDGKDYRIVPVFMERNYDEEYKGKDLSDHLGFEAIYKITPKT